MKDLELPTFIPRWILALIQADKCPGVPLCGGLDLAETLGRLIGRAIQVEQARNGLTNTYQIGNTSGTAEYFLFGSSTLSEALAALKQEVEKTENFADTLFQDAKDLLLSKGAEASAQHFANTLFQDAKHLLQGKGAEATAAAKTASNSPTQLSLTSADQWGMSWTNYAGVFERAQASVLQGFSAALAPENPAEASRRFWPTIAQYGLGTTFSSCRKSPFRGCKSSRTSSLRCGSPLGTPRRPMEICMRSICVSSSSYPWTMQTCGLHRRP